MQVDAKQRYLMITEAAYFLAEKRGFAPGNEHDDWVAAERQVDAMLSALDQNPDLEQRIEAGEKPKRSRRTATAGATAAGTPRRARKTAAEPAAAGAMTAPETAKPTRARKTAAAEKPARTSTRSRAKSSPAT